MTPPKSDTGNEPPTVTKHRRAPKGEKRREELLDAALQVFSLEGYTGASMAQVAGIVGISVAGLLHHFPSKVSLLMGVLERRDAISQKIADEVRGDNTLTGLLGSLRAINRSNATAPGVVRAFTILNAESLLANQPAWEWFQNRYQMIHGRLVGQFQELVDAGEVLPQLNISGLVEEILAMMDGLQIQWLRFPERFDLVKRFDDYMARVDTAIRVVR
jgi:AcrR family transcriptional regulator